MSADTVDPAPQVVVSSNNEVFLYLFESTSAASSSYILKLSSDGAAFIALATLDGCEQHNSTKRGGLLAIDSRDYLHAVCTGQNAIRHYEVSPTGGMVSHIAEEGRTDVRFWNGLQAIGTRGKGNR